MPAVLIGAVALGGAAVAAGGIGLALGAAGLTGFFANLGASLILSGVSQALMPKPKTTMQPRTVTIREPVVPRELVYGRARKGGVIVFMNASGTDNKYLDLVIVLAAHRVKSIGAVYFEGEEAVNAAGVVQGRWAGKLTIEKALGSDTQSAFPGLRSDLPTLWTTSHRLRGCAAIRLRLTYNNDAYPNGIPNITVDVEGKDDILDPRTGTRGYSTNAALCLADFMAHPQFGLGAVIGAEDGIQTADLIEAANICDETVALTGGGTEKRYACNGVVSLQESPKTIIEAMLTAMAGQCVWQGGAWKVHAGAYRAPTVTLTSDDVRDGGLSLATRISRSQNFNGVRGQFVSPENDWQPDDFPAYSSATYRAEDGGEEVWRDISLPFTISASTAQRLAKIELERQRRQMTVQIDGKLSAWRAAVGETVMLSYDRWGFAAKPFEVRGLSLDLSAAGDGALLVPELVLRETSPLVYDWSASEEQIYAAAPRTSLPSAFDIAPPGIPQLSEELYATRDGTAVRALLRVEWTPSPSGYVDQYQVQARRTKDASGAATGDDWISFGRTDQLFWEIRDIAPGTWQVRVKGLTVLGVSSDYATASLDALGLSAPPAALTNVSIQTAGGLAILKWDVSPDLDVRIGGRIVIRHSASGSPTWANSVSIDEEPGQSSVGVVPLKPGTYLLRARDSSGMLGPVVTVSTKGAQAVPFANLDTLTEDPGWTGTKTNCQIDGTALKITNLASEGVYTFPAGMDFLTETAVRLRSVIDVSALSLTSTIDDRLDPIDTWSDFDGTEGADTDVIVEVRTTDDDPSGSPVWSDWSRLDSTEDAFRAAQFRARLITRSEDFNVLLAGLTVFADEVI